LALSGPFFLDTSVLLGGLVEIPGRNAGALRVMDAAFTGELAPVTTAWHCCLEFYAVATRLPEELRLTPADVLALLEEQVFPRFEIAQLPAGAGREVLAAAAREEIGGGRVYDHHLAEVARLAGAAVVVTDNLRHFAALSRHGIRLLDSQGMAAELAG
jgi:predicted nucleic acid-binding protein